MTKTPTTTHLFTKFHRSRRALAVPATFLILFVTMLGMVSVTYYFSIEKVSAQSQTLKVATAKKDMLSLDDAILSVLWEPGSARRVDFDNSGGELNVQPSANSMLINITDEEELSSIAFNGTIGQVSYALPYSPSSDTGIFLKGESRTIINQSGSGITQLCIGQGVEHPEIQLRYRPIVSCTEGGFEGNQPVNNLRIYIVTLNSSDVVELVGALSLKVSCVATEVTTATYNLSYPTEAVLVTCAIDQESGQVSVPIESTADGAIVHVELVLCRVEIDRVVR
jgi:hypothetical protein